MINDIEDLNEKYEHLPLILKLGAYRRSFLMKGISKGPNNDNKRKGENILKALNLYKDKINPGAFAETDFEEFINDPIGFTNRDDIETKKKKMMEKYNKKRKYNTTVERGKVFGYDMDEFCEYIKDQREDIDYKMREQINKQKMAFKKQRAQTRMFKKIKTLSKLFSEETQKAEEPEDALSEIKEDSDDLEEIGVHHVGGRVITIDHDLIKNKAQKLTRKQTIMANFKKKVTFSKSFSRQSSGLTKNKKTITPRISPAHSPAFTPVGSPKQTPKGSPKKILEVH